VSLPRLLIIDGYSLAFRAYYAYPPTLKLENGLVVNAVFGFIALLFKAIEDLTPQGVLICFDRKEPTFRHVQFEAYKAQRSPTPEDFIVQMSHLRMALDQMGFVCIEKPGFEADDLIGTIAVRASALGWEVRILTGDHDALQLVDETVHVVMSKKSEMIIYDQAKVIETYSFGPRQIVDYKALRGDTSDNIPGVKGIGEKTATTLIMTYQNLDGIYAHLDEIMPAGVQQKLRDGKEQAYLSQYLATIDTAVEIAITSDEWQFRPNWVAIIEVFKAYAFKSLVQKYQKKIGIQEVLIITPEMPVARTDFEVFKSTISSLNAGFSLWYTQDAMQVGIACKDQVWTLFASEALWDSLRPLLEAASISKFVFDGKTLGLALARMGIVLSGIREDVLLAGYLLNPGKIPTWGELMERVGLSFDTTAADDGQYAWIIDRLSEPLRQALVDQQLDALYEHIELPLIPVLRDMERHGIKVDLGVLKTLGDRLEITLAALRGQCFELAGMDFNVSSPKQLADVLFDHLQLPVIKKTKTSRSTDSSVLEKLRDHHPIAEVILQYRQLEKLLNTYIHPLPLLVNATTQTIHSSFQQMVTATGRLSSSNPNLQNIPTRTPEGLAIREAFIPSGPDRVLMAADYSQIELRVLAYVSGDERMCQAFARGEDIHTSTAAQVFHVPVAEVTKEQRYKAKAVNFGIIYGQSAFGLSETLGIPVAEAKEIISLYFKTFTKIKTFMEETLVGAREKGYVTTEFGRVRPIPEIQASNGALRQFAERTAINTRIQGTAADLIKIAMIRLSEVLKPFPNSYMVLQVHDELVLDVANEDVIPVQALLVETMRDVVSWPIPLEVDVEIGRNWMEISV